MLNPRAKKLQVKSGQKILLSNPPNAYSQLLEPLPDNTSISTELAGNYDHFQLFVKSSSELADTLKAVHKLLLPASIIWIVYPKKSSGIRSDLDMMSSWEEPGKYGLRPVSSASIDETWTAIRLKPCDQVKKSGVGKSEIRDSDMNRYIDVENRIVTLPPDIKAELETDASALAFFETLSWTNKKEYVTWILTAKQEKTRTIRVKKTAEMLAAGKKNPSGK